MQGELAQAAVEYRLLDQVPMGMILLRSDFTVLFWNACLEAWADIPREAVLGQDVRKTLPHLGEPMYAERLESIFIGGPPATFPSQLHRFVAPCPLPDGQLHHQHTTMTAVPAANGGRFFALLAIQDVTELTRRIQECPAMRDPARQEVALRNRADLALRQGQQELEQCVEQRTQELALMNEVLQNEIVEHGQAEAELWDEHAWTALMMASIPSIMISVDADGRIIQWNAAAETIFGIAAEKALGGALADCGIQWSWPAVAEAMDKCRAARQQVRLEDLHFLRPDGSEGILGLAASAIVDSAGQPGGVMLLGADVTERLELEAQLAQSQKLEAMGQLAAGIAHEINTPTQYVGDNVRFLQDAFHDLLECMSKYADLLAAARKGPVPPALVEAVDASVRAADVGYLINEAPKAIQQSLEGVERVTRIVRAMKEFSHPGAKQKTPIDLNNAIQNTTSVCRNEWKYVAELELDLDPSLPPVECLPGDLNQVLLNLIINAAHAIQDAQAAGRTEKGRICIRTSAAGGWAEIRVSDTGCGIPEAVRSKIFNLFFTTKEVGRGTGQGLTIARAVIVEKHGGTLDFESEVGKGTTFLIRLPISADTGKNPPVEEAVTHVT